MIMFNVYAKNLEGKRRYLGRCRGNDSSAGIFEMYADECGDEEEVVQEIINGEAFVKIVDLLLNVKGKKRQELADNVGFNVCNFSNWKTKDQLPTLSCAIGIADYLDVSIYSLLEYNVTNIPQNQSIKDAIEYSKKEIIDLLIKNWIKDPITI